MKLLKEQPQEIERSQLFKDFKAVLDQNRENVMGLKKSFKKAMELTGIDVVQCIALICEWKFS